MVRRFVILGVGAMLASSGGAALAQRNGDVRGGLDNQPTTGEVRSRERAAGVLPPPVVQQRQTGAVDSIYENLMNKEGAAGGPPPRAPAPR